MEEKKVTTMELKVDLQCRRCYNKVKKVLSKFPQIKDQRFDEKANTVTITVVCCSPEKFRDKLCRKGGGAIKCIKIITAADDAAASAVAAAKSAASAASSASTASSAASSAAKSAASAASDATASAASSASASAAASAASSSAASAAASADSAAKSAADAAAAATTPPICCKRCHCVCVWGPCSCDGPPPPQPPLPPFYCKRCDRLCVWGPCCCDGPPPPPPRPFCWTFGRPVYDSLSC